MVALDHSVSRVAFILIVLVGSFGSIPESWGATVSSDSDACLACHLSVTPGIVGDWEKSRHARTTVQEALRKAGAEREVSSETISGSLMRNSVGCAECHTINPEKHKDTFDHQGYRVHLVVTPDDCATCHATEADQYAGSLMAHAYGNLTGNTLYRDLADSINGTQSFAGGKLSMQAPGAAADADSCLSCHGTSVDVKGTVSRETPMGNMTFPVLSNWPNQGVGRLNPDASRGSCAACHSRHLFSIETARKPYTCAECHKGPDVPAYKVYSVSKHGNIASAHEKEWDFAAVPWTVGKHFNAPTCATCHMSELINDDGQIIAPRTHGVGDRLPWRIFGLIYAHPSPKSPDTTPIRNQAGLPLPTALTGEPAAGFLIDAKEQATRQGRMQAICLSCHGRNWVNGHWARFENTIKDSDAMVLSATQIVLNAWAKGLAGGPTRKDSLFNEPIEKLWVEQWLFYANSVRFSSAMAGADYGAFENGRWNLSKNLREMKEWSDLHLKMRR